MKLFAFQGILNTALVIGFNLVFLLVFDMGVTGYLLSVVISDFLTAIFLFVYARLSRDLAAGRFSFSLMRDMIKYSVPMIPTTIFWWITNVSDRYFVTWLCGDDASGLYSAAYKIPTLLTLLCTVFYEAWQFSAVKDAEEKTQSKFFGSVFSYYSSLMFMAGAGVVLFCRVFVSLLFADQYSEAWVYIPVLTAAAVFSALTTFMGSVYLVKKRTGLSFLTSMIGAVANLVLNFLMIPYWGAQGAAIATVISYIAVFVIRAVSVQKYVRFFVNYLRLAVNSILLAVMCVITVLEVQNWWVLSAATMLIMLAVNAKTLIKSLAGAVKQFGRRRY
jgi:O-antigen/teichoic acid export membrane protein